MKNTNESGFAAVGSLVPVLAWMVGISMIVAVTLISIVLTGKFLFWLA